MNNPSRNQKPVEVSNNYEISNDHSVTFCINLHVVIIQARNLTTSVDNLLEPNPYVTCVYDNELLKTQPIMKCCNPLYHTPLTYDKVNIFSKEPLIYKFSVLDANPLLRNSSFGFAEIGSLESFEQDGELRAFIEKLRFMKATATIPQVYQEDAIDERGVWCRIDPESKELVHLLVQDVWLPLEGVSQGELHVRLVLEARIKPDGGNLNSPRHPLDPIVYSDEVVASFEEARRARLHSPCKELFYPSMVSEVSHEVRCILSARHAKLVEERQFWRWTRALTKNPHILEKPQPHEYYKQEFSSVGVASGAVVSFTHSSELSNLIRRGLPSKSACSNLSPLVLPDGSEGGTSRGSHLPKVSACVEGHKVVLNQYALYKVNAYVYQPSQESIDECRTAISAERVSKETVDDVDNGESVNEEYDDGSISSDSTISSERTISSDSDDDILWSSPVLKTKSCVWRRYSDFTTLARVENKPMDKITSGVLGALFNPFNKDFLCTRQAAVDTFLQELLASQQSGSSHLSPTTIEFLGLTCAPPSLFPMLENMRMHVWLSLSGGAELALTKKIGYSFSELKVAAFSKQIWIAAKGDGLFWDSCEREAFVEIDLDLERTSGGWEKWSHHEGGEALSDTEKHSLRTVLRAIALAVPSVGYCQSMNFIGLMILRNVCNGLDAEENAFYILLAFVSCVAPRYFNHTMDAARTDLVLFGTLIQEQLPDLSGQILSLGIPLELVASPWLLGLLSQDDFFPPHVVMRVWDWMVLDGVDVIIYVLLAFLRKLSPVILKSQDINTCIAEIRSQATNWLDAEELIELAEREVATVGGCAKLASLRAKIALSHSSNTDIAAAKHHLLAKTKTLTQYLVQGFKNPQLSPDERKSPQTVVKDGMVESEVDTAELDEDDVVTYVGFVCELLGALLEAAMKEDHGIMFDDKSESRSPLSDGLSGGGAFETFASLATASSLAATGDDVNIRIHRARLKLLNKLPSLTIIGETLAIITERAVQTISEAKLENAIQEKPQLLSISKKPTVIISQEISNLIQEVVTLNSVQGSQFFSNALQFVCALVVLGPLPPYVKMKLCFSTLIYAHRAASSSSRPSKSNSFREASGGRISDICNDIVMILSGPSLLNDVESAMNSEKVPLKECVDLIHFLVVLTQPSRAQGDVEACLGAVVFNACQLSEEKHLIASSEDMEELQEGDDDNDIDDEGEEDQSASEQTSEVVPLSQCGRVEHSKIDGERPVKLESIAGYFLAGTVFAPLSVADLHDKVVSGTDQVVNTLEKSSSFIESALSDAVDDISKVTTSFRFNEKTSTIEMNCKMFCQVLDSHPLAKACFNNGLLE